MWYIFSFLKIEGSIKYKNSEQKLHPQQMNLLILQKSFDGLLELIKKGGSENSNSFTVCV
ncbi:hypothetical protein BV902_21390 [Sphingobacterium sp. B29]|nr:hypothetical protein BV902_21390 [Sphingobacterium sp. B29]